MAEPPGISPELEALMAGLGIDPSGFSAAGADRSPPVFMGARSGGTTRTRMRDGKRAGNAKIGSVDDIRTEDEAVNDFYSWDDAKVRDFQERAFSAGLYGTLDRSRVRFGDPTDADTFNIWKDRVVAAAGFYNQGRKVTPWDALDMAGMGGSGLEGVGSDGPSATNPLDFQALARQEGTAGLGRGLTVQEQGKVAGALQAAEAPYLGAGGSVSRPGGAAMQEIAKQQVRGLDAVRFDSRNAVKVASVIEQMMSGQMPQYKLPAEEG